MNELENLIHDGKAREEALDVARSFIVEAPAGSGKTTLLVQRFLRLLSVVEKQPEECLAITFTRKAASEMRDRIVHALEMARSGQQSSKPDQQTLIHLAKVVLERDQALEWNLIENPSRLKIQTIDSFCAALAQQAPIVSQFGAFPRIAEDSRASYELAAHRVVASLEKTESWTEALRSLLLHLDNNIPFVVNLLADMLANREHWLAYVGYRAGGQARYRLEENLRSVITGELHTLISSLPTIFVEGLPLLRFAAQYNEDLRVFGQCTHWPSEHLEDLGLWQSLGNWLLTQSGELRKTVTERQGFPPVSSANNAEEKILFQAMKQDMKQWLEKLQEYPEFIASLFEVLHCPPQAYSDEQWTTIENFLEVLTLLAAQLSLVFQEKGEVDFTEVAFAALKALGDSEAPTDLALMLDYRIRHILVDEFQDTSITQYQLLQKLTVGWEPLDGRTLFLVGDPMQSIYRFRQAEVGLFVRCQQKGLGNISLNRLQLTTNFRSDPCLVDWVNQYGSQTFAKQDDIASGAIQFRFSYAARDPEDTALASVMSVDANNETDHVINLVKKTLKDDPKASIAILVRSRSFLGDCLAGLRQNGIEYQGLQLEPLNNRPLINDLWTLTRALSHVGDRIAWLSILRTPWCFISLHDLYHIANWAPNDPLWHSLLSFEGINELSAQAKTVLGSVVPILQKALAQSQRISFVRLIKDTWLALQKNELMTSLDREQAQMYFTLLETLPDDQLETGLLEKRLARLFADKTSAVDTPLQIMTIHKAKGLEFDTVIVPGVGRRSREDPNTLLMWSDTMGLEEHYLLLAPIKSIGFEKDPIYAYLRRQEKRKALHEQARLFYVAATRARKRLYWLVHE